MLFNYKKNKDWVENLSVITQLGLTMAGCIIFCFFVGRFLDRLFHLKGIFVMLFILFGIAGGANVVYRQILEITEDKKARKKDDGNRGINQID